MVRSIMADRMPPESSPNVQTVLFIDGLQRAGGKRFSVAPPQYGEPLETASPERMILAPGS
jgi:hypothetical protein